MPKHIQKKRRYDRVWWITFVHILVTLIIAIVAAHTQRVCEDLSKKYDALVETYMLSTAASIQQEEPEVYILDAKTLPLETLDNVERPEIVASYTKTTAEKIAFAEAIFAVAKEREDESQVPAEIVTAIAVLESGHGQSALAVRKNNIFGINGQNGYRTFDSINDCIDEFYRIMTLPRYSHLLGTPIYLWVNGLADAGYADVDDYPEALQDVLNWLTRRNIFSLAERSNNYGN